MPDRRTDEEVTQQLRRSTERLHAVLDEPQRAYTRLDAVVARLSSRYLPARRPNLRLIEGDREEDR